MQNLAHNDSVHLAFDVEGDGPDLFLIPGVASTRPLWNLVRPALARHFRTIAFDLRDTGESTLAGAPYTIGDLVADAIAVMDAAGSHRAHVLGHSLGGIIAQELALAHPARVETLALVSTVARGDAYSKNVVSLLRTLTDTVSGDFAFLAALLYVGAGETTLRSANLLEMTAAALALGPLPTRAAIARQWDVTTTVDTLERLPSLSMPVRVIWGTEDRLLPPRLSEAIVDAVPHATATRIDRCGHLPMVAAPDAFIAAITAAS